VEYSLRVGVSGEPEQQTAFPLQCQHTFYFKQTERERELAINKLLRWWQGDATRTVQYSTTNDWLRWILYRLPSTCQVGRARFDKRATARGKRAQLSFFQSNSGNGKLALATQQEEEMEVDERNISSSYLVNMYFKW